MKSQADKLFWTKREPIILTAKQLKIAELLRDGFSARKIGERTGVGTSTILKQSKWIGIKAGTTNLHDTRAKLRLHWGLVRRETKIERSAKYAGFAKLAKRRRRQ